MERLYDVMVHEDFCFTNTIVTVGTRVTFIRISVVWQTSIFVCMVLLLMLHCLKENSNWNSLQQAFRHKNLLKFLFILNYSRLEIRCRTSQLDKTIERNETGQFNTQETNSFWCSNAIPIMVLYLIFYYLPVTPAVDRTPSNNQSVCQKRTVF